MNKMKTVIAEQPGSEPVKEDEVPLENPATPVEKPIETPTPIKVPETVPADILKKVEWAIAA